MYSFSDVGLCCGSIAEADFRTLAECAGSAGFRFITLWPGHFERALESGLSAADMRSVLVDNKLSVSELDPLCMWRPSTVAPDDIAAPFYRYDESDFFRIADELGARSLNVIHAGSEPIDRARIVDTLASLCERAARHGLIVSVEFMPWSPIGNLATALDLVMATGRSDCGVNVDSWHHFRSGGTIAELAALPANAVTAIQLSEVDAEPWDDPLQETARGRRLPGEGAGHSVAVIEAFDRAGVGVPINVEVFSDDLRRLPPERAASVIAERTRTIMAHVAQRGSGTRGTGDPPA